MLPLIHHSKSPWVHENRHVHFRIHVPYILTLTSEIRSEPFGRSVMIKQTFGFRESLGDIAWMTLILERRVKSKCALPFWTAVSCIRNFWSLGTEYWGYNKSRLRDIHFEHFFVFLSATQFNKVNRGKTKTLTRFVTRRWTVGPSAVRLANSLRNSNQVEADWTWVNCLGTKRLSWYFHTARAFRLFSISAFPFCKKKNRDEIHKTFTKSFVNSSRNLILLSWFTFQPVGFQWLKFYKIQERVLCPLAHSYSVTTNSSALWQ